MTLRWTDRSLAALLLLTLWPVLVVVGLTVVILSRRSPFVAHRRVGKGAQAFWMLKFRSMWPAATPGASEFHWIERLRQPDGTAVKPRRDPRVTSAFAAFCRTYSLDELPQLVHVVRGQMSLVGPRPLTAAELREFYPDCMDEVLSVAPGLSGLWQTRGRNTLSYRRRARYDQFLAERYSWPLYWRILLSTVPKILRGEGAW